MYMQNDWSEYNETRRELKQRKPRVLLSKDGALRLNAKAIELLGSPEAIRLLFDVQRSRIGVRAEAAEREYALPLRTEKKSSLVHIKSFCNRYRIELESTIEFTDVRTDSTGVMLLDLTTARRTVR